MHYADKSLPQLRAMAQAMGVAVGFADSKESVGAAIAAALATLVVQTAPVPTTPTPVTALQAAMREDPRLRTLPPARNLACDQVVAALAPLLGQGLAIAFPSPDSWQLRYGQREDSGSLHVPLRVIMNCATALMRP